PTTPSAAPAAAAEGAQAKEEVPSYQMTFTCKACSTRSSHRISKQGYHKGTVLIACPGCKNRHLISDHLKIFSDKSITLEDILKDKGEKLKLGHVSDDGDLEFWDDGSQTPR
ncbi:zf-DNL-domain-containing protein, partial [Saccharata proteae CBS 121410]